MIHMMKHEKLQKESSDIMVSTLLEKYANQWGLLDFEQIDYYSVNCIFKCVSSEHGDCILKIGNDSKAIESEYQILNEYKGKRFCKAYESDTANGALLIERITPGIQLRNEPDLNKRLDIFCELYKGLHIEPATKTIYPTYLGWVKGITEYMRSRRDYKTLYEKMLKAEEICHELCEKYRGNMLLHGDLHQENILLNDNNHYCIVDPRGVIGDIVFDIPRFIINEFPRFMVNELDTSMDDFCAKFTHIIRVLSKRLNVPEYDLRRLTYVEMCLDSCWDAEDGKEAHMEDVLFAEKMMDN